LINNKLVSITLDNILLWIRKFITTCDNYSEDIDLVQINSEPIKETIDKIRNVLSFLGKPVVKQKAHNNTLIFRFNF